MRFLTAALMLGLSMPADAAKADDTAVPAPRTGRFTMVPAEGGFVRLDTETGIVSHCRREGEGDAAGWHCAAIPEDILSAPDRVQALKSDVDQLHDQVKDLGRRLAALADAMPKAEAPRIPAPQTVTPRTMTPQAVTPPPRIESESDRELDFGEELMRRFFGLIREMKRADQAALP